MVLGKEDNSSDESNRLDWDGWNLTVNSGYVVME